MNDGRRATLPRLRRKCRRRSGARATPRWSAERRTLRGTGTPRKREVASYRRDELRWTPPGAPPAPHFGVGAAADAKDLGASPAEAPAKAAEMRWRQKNNDATTRAQKMRRGNETGCVDKITRRAVSHREEGRREGGPYPAWASRLRAASPSMGGLPLTAAAGGDRHPSRSGIAKREPDQLSARTTGPRRG